MAESDKLVYDNATVTGSEVINVVKKMSGSSIGIYVLTNKTSAYYGYKFDLSTGALGEKTDTDINNATLADNGNYINPYANFKGIVVRDVNDVITGIKFEQS
jgi:hypothetical protein